MGSSDPPSVSWHTFRPALLASTLALLMAGAGLAPPGAQASLCDGTPLECSVLLEPCGPSSSDQQAQDCISPCPAGTPGAVVGGDVDGCLDACDIKAGDDPCIASCPPGTTGTVLDGRPVCLSIEDCAQVKDCLECPEGEVGVAYGPLDACQPGCDPLDESCIPLGCGPLLDGSDQTPGCDLLLDAVAEGTAPASQVPAFDYDCEPAGVIYSVCAWARSSAGRADDGDCPARPNQGEDEDEYCIYHESRGGGSSTTDSGYAVVKIHGTGHECPWSKATYTGQGVPGCDLGDREYLWKPVGFTEVGPCVRTETTSYAYGPLGEQGGIIGKAEAHTGAFCP
jgi:hypothetical protein